MISFNWISCMLLPNISVLVSCAYNINLMCLFPMASTFPVYGKNNKGPPELRPEVLHIL